MRFLILLLILIPVSLSAQIFPYSSDITEKAVNSIEDIAASIISDSFAPMTHYSADQKTFSVVPAGFKIEKFMDDPEITGDDFNGKSLGAGAGFALTDGIMAYIIIAGMKMDGDFEYAAYGEQFGVLKSRADYSLFSIIGGGGYDLINNDIFSIPVFFGAQIQYFSAELMSDPVTWTSYTADMETTGDGFLYGVSGGIAFSAKIFNMVKITPYFLYMRNFNNAKMKSDITLTGIGVPLKERFELEIDPVSAGMIGLNIGLASQSGFSASIALGSMISSWTDYSLDSSEKNLEMKSVVLIFSYGI